MKKKSKKPADELIQSVLEDLKQSPDSVVISPEGLVDHESTEDDPSDATDLLAHTEDDSSESEFFKELKINMGVGSESKSESHTEEESDLSKELEKIAKAANSNRSPKSSKASEKPVDETNILGSLPSLDEMPLANSDSDKTNPLSFPEPTVLASKPLLKHDDTESPMSKNSNSSVKVRGSSYEAQFAQAENLKIAQQRILELEKEVERLRKENEVLSSASEISRQKIEDLVAQVYQLDKQKMELEEVSESELKIFKDGLTAKDTEILRLRNKVDELELRLSNDLRKVRVRERELENRLELSKAEKAALLRAKDETILELKRKTENLESEVETYQNKIIELGQKLELNHDQFARTVRALRLALTNLEVSDGTSPSITLAPYKKAE